MSIPFTCPHCGAQTNVPDEFAGQSGPCASCNKTITIPHSPHPKPPAAKSTGSSVGIIVAVLLVIVVGCGGLLAALLLPAVQAAREAARRMECQNNLKQIALAFHNYHDTHKTFPPAYFTDENGQPTHSWRVMILPFLGTEGANIYAQYDFDEPWDGPNNRMLMEQMPSIYSCPSHPQAAGSVTNYMAVTGPQTVFPDEQSCGLRDILDGTSNTILVVEVAGSNANWMEPTDLKLSQVPMKVNAGKNGASISSYHPGGAQVAFADGSVRFITETIDPKVLRLLLEKADGQPVGNF